MVGVAYLFSVIYIFATFMLCKKNRERISFINFFFLSLVLLLCYNMIVCFILNAIHVIISIKVLSIINAVNASILLFYIIRKREIQKYYLNFQSIAFIISILIIVLVMAYLNFGKDFCLRYVMTDSSVHFSVAKEFYDSGKLGGEVIGAYTNTGILFKVLEPYIGEPNLYKVFMCFDIFLLFLMGTIMYAIVEKVINKELSAITLLLIVLFLIGYPYNIFLYGFVYLQLGIIVIATIIGLLQYWDYKKMNKKWMIVLLMMCNFGIFFSYCLLAPAIYIAELLFIIYKSNKKIFTKENLIIITIVFGIPIVCGILFIVVPHLNKTNNETVFYNLEGYIYRNLWSNFVLLIPIAITIINKKNDDSFLWMSFFITLIIIMIGAFIAVNKLHLSTYYYYKFNFLLWFLLWYGIIYAVNSLNVGIGKYLIVYMMIYAIVTGICMKYKSVGITKEYFDSDENITNAFDIYCLNTHVVKNFAYAFDKEEMKIVDYIRENIDLKKDKILILGNPIKLSWFRAFFNYSNRENLELVIPSEDIEKWNNKEYKYLLIYNNAIYLERYDRKLNSGKIIMSNKSGTIYLNE